MKMFRYQCHSCNALIALYQECDITIRPICLACNWEMEPETSELSSEELSKVFDFVYRKMKWSDQADGTS